MLDIFIYLARSFDKIQASVSNLYWDLDIEDNVFAILQNSKTKILNSGEVTAFFVDFSKSS